MNLYQKILESENFFLIAGPCVIEDSAILYKIAETLKKITEERNIPYIFKASYLKANRTSESSYSGPGLDEGLKILEKIKREFELPILTDIHQTEEAELVAEVADILQIPAFLARQTFLIKSAAKTGKIVNLKKAQFMAPEDMKGAVDKVVSEENTQVMITERGTSFGYHNLVVDFRGFPVMKQFGYPVVYDVTHSLQKPSIKNVSGGTPEYVPMMAKAAMATGLIDGIFIETHPNPEKGLSDAKSMINLDLMGQLLDELIAIKEVVR
ncbi:MAG: 3-deoxy-8-phosphooctulonate synthase [Candidatus Cloacimonas sp.]|nr:3-deoxy-8-phosphooctulonate synthase [Candidatus Cloacimonadota bacterium]